MEYINEINREALKHERNIYERLGNHKGIISCLKASDYGIELAFAKQGDLERYRGLTRAARILQDQVDFIY